jgi:hypothetical protein
MFIAYIAVVASLLFLDVQVHPNNIVIKAATCEELFRCGMKFSPIASD